MPSSKLLGRRMRWLVTVGVAVAGVSLIVRLWIEDTTEFAAEALLGSTVIALFCSYLIYVTWAIYRPDKTSD